MSKRQYNDEELKLIYILKVGYNSKNEGIFEFIFSYNETNIDEGMWGWDLVPACNYAEPPSDDYVDLVVSLKTKDFNLFCLHEAVDREYMHGYHTIHALAYEIDVENPDIEDGYDKLFDNDDLPLLVFHYGMTLKQIKDLLYVRKLILRDDTFVNAKNVDI